MPRQRVAVFGGTFDPPHLGHLIVASEVRHRCGFDRVLLMVNHDPWQKRGQRMITDGAVRLEMVEAAVTGHDGLVADDTELRRGGATYTIDTIEALAAADPDVELSLVLGTDAVAGLDSWHRATDLAGLVDVVEVRRPGAPVARPARPWNVTPVDTPLIEISSTDIRDRCGRGAPIDFLVTEGVRSVIVERGLYGVRR
ncbi:MAG: nicotinate-nucleotide adenylyltransferase [Acidimicrobiales bacterium]